MDRLDNKYHNELIDWTPMFVQAKNNRGLITNRIILNSNYHEQAEENQYPGKNA
jgi:hypothetical protein